MNKLAAIAAEMRSYAIDNPRLSTAADISPFRRSLPGGLRLVLYLDAYQNWHLSLYRENVYPSRTEIQLINRAFNIPDDALETIRQVGPWHIIKLKWAEPGDQKLFTLGPKQVR